VHASLRSFGWIEGGASTIIQGFLAESCTLLVPTFSWDTFSIPAPVAMRPARNGYDYARPRPPAPGVNRVYTRSAAEVDADMGMLPVAVLALPGHLRGNHPLCSFTAVGPHAPTLMAEQAPLQVLAPLSALAVAQGWVLLLGVGLESMTLLHLAEQRAGRRLFRRWANGPTGVPEEVEVGGCSAGFEQLAPRLAALEQRIQVGESLWRAFPAQAALEVAQRAIQQQPSITQCADADCGRCRDSIAGGPLPTLQTPDAS
jgi:aminoglycoside N3'-acetyltransferase